MVSVSGLAASGFQPSAGYYVLPADDDIPPSDLQFQEYKSYLDRALKMRGMVTAATPAGADTVIVFGYGIDGPETQHETYSEPIRGQTGIKSSRTTRTVQGHGDSETVSEETTYDTTYGITGYATRHRTFTTYRRHFEVVAYDENAYQSGGTEKVLWRTDVVSIGGSGDLRRVLPAMMAAAAQHLASNTGQAVTVTILEDGAGSCRARNRQARRPVAPQHQIPVTPFFPGLWEILPGFGRFCPGAWG